MVELKHRGVNIKTIAAYTRRGIYKNKLHNYIRKTQQFNVDSMMDLCGIGLNRKLGRFYETTTSKLLEFLLFRYIILCSILFVNDKNILKYIKSTKPNLVVVDHRTMNASYLHKSAVKRFIDIILRRNNNSMNNVLFRILKQARMCGIPIFMIPHGLQPMSKSSLGVVTNINNPFRPDYLVICSKNDVEYCRSLYVNASGLKDTYILGDAKFDARWMKYVRSCVLDMYDFNDVKDNKILLYFTDVYHYKEKIEIHKDIISLVNKYDDLEIWITHHPRHRKLIPIKDFVDDNKLNRVKQILYATDSDYLIEKADICITTISGFFVTSILQKKPSIVYNKWKEYLGPTETIYDGRKLTVNTKSELDHMMDKVIDGEWLKTDDINEFHNRIFSVDADHHMLDDYVDKMLEKMEA